MVFHEITEPRDQGRFRESAPDRSASGRRPGGEANPRSPLRLRGLAGPLATGEAGSLSGAGAECGRPDHRGAREGADPLPFRLLLGYRRHLLPQVTRTARGPAESDGNPTFPGTLVAVDGVKVATGADFDEQGASTARMSSSSMRKPPPRSPGRWREAEFSVRTIESKPYRRSPYPPFRTSTLQQEASRKLRFAASRTMSVAQRLYEAGYITYMRTDSTALSEAAVAAARNQITQLYGPEYLPKQPRTYANKVKNAQEAHEAIRPSGDHSNTRSRLPARLARTRRGCTT